MNTEIRTPITERTVDIHVSTVLKIRNLLCNRESSDVLLTILKYLLKQNFDVRGIQRRNRIKRHLEFSTFFHQRFFFRFVSKLLVTFQSHNYHTQRTCWILPNVLQNLFKKVVWKTLQRRCIRQVNTQKNHLHVFQTSTHIYVEILRCTLLQTTETYQLIAISHRPVRQFNPQTHRLTIPTQRTYQRILTNILRTHNKHVYLIPTTLLLLLHLLCRILLPTK